ncbi:MAG: pseudouridine synthase [Polyangia bacterium]
MPEERLQKILAAAGVASRRKAEELIAAGRVRVDGKVVSELGAKADADRQRIEVDGSAVVAEPPLTVLLNKPRGVVSTVSDPQQRPTVVGLVSKVRARLFPVGRLDYDTSGALLLTNDGDLAQALTHPRHGVEKSYLVKLRGRVPLEVVERWREGVAIGRGEKTRPADVSVAEQADNYTWLAVTIAEGRNRQIRRMAEATSQRVAKLKRVSFAGVTIEGLPVGRYRPLTDRELSRLKRDHLSPHKRASKKGQKRRRS